LLSSSLAWGITGGSDAPEGVSADRSAAGGEPRHRTFGMGLDVGVPDGAALTFLVRPYLSWLRVGGAVTHNGIAPGVRGSVTIDPIAFPLAPTLTVEGGHYWEGNLPIVKDSRTVGYDYANFHLGLEVGNRETFRFFLRGGASWVDVSSGPGAPVTTGATMGIASYSGWLAPSAKLGFAAYF
jgi:hypothetical protein